MTIFVQIGSLWALNKLIDIKLKEYAVKLILPLFAFTILCLPIPLWLSKLMMDGWLRLIVITIVSTSISSILFFFLVLDKQEKETALNLVKKITVI